MFDNNFVLTRLRGSYVWGGKDWDYLSYVAYNCCVKLTVTFVASIC